MSIGQLIWLGCILLGFVAVPIFIIMLLTTDWGREERIEESMTYDPEPIWEARFTTPDEEIRRQR